MARNRKRRSDRRPRRPEGATSQPGVATASGGRPEDTPDPIEHATPDVELAEAQLAVGRPELAGDELGDEELIDDELIDDELDDDGADSDLGGGGGGRSGPRGGASSSGSAALPAPRSGNRIVQFLQGSWRELQRVQWPDRRQVMQATGVVIGFVIVAGVFLGVADFVATKVVNFILK